MRAFTGKRRRSHAPLLRAPRAQSRPRWIFHAPLSVDQSAPSSARSKLSSHGAAIVGRSAALGWAAGLAVVAFVAVARAVVAGLLAGAPASAVGGPSGTHAASAVSAATCAAT